MSTIFISHSSADAAAAAEMADWLKRHGHHSLFLDFDAEHGIPAGRDWERELYHHLRTCQAMIVLCSEAAMASCWCLAELSHARALGKRIFPVRIAPCRLRPQLAELQVIDLVEAPEAGHERLRRALSTVFAWDRRRPPYPGLMAFEESDAAIFFGRDAEIQAALDRLQRLRRFGGPRLLLLLGASGSGKSSLVRAGVLPRLRAAPESWAVIGPIRPRDRPFDALSARLTRGLADAGLAAEGVSVRLGDADTAAEALPALGRELRLLPGREHATLVLFIDQLEELLTDSAQAARCMGVLRPVLQGGDTPLLVIATLRSDFLGAFQQHPAWRDLSFEPLTVEPLSVDGFAAVIEGPAELAGLDLEAGLTRAMVAETATEDALPLLAFTLRELWEQGGDDGRLTLAEYRDRLGGLHGSVARAAEAVLTAAAPTVAEEQALRGALLALVRLDDEGRYTRQVVRWQDLPDASHPLLERFVAARLLIAGRHDDARTLEVAHESLFRVWRRLDRWLAASREALRIHDGLRRAATEWEEGGRLVELLVHRGTRLEAAEALAGEGLVPLGDVERDYLGACRALRDAELAESRRRARVRRRWIAATGLILVVGVIGLSWLALSLNRQAQVTRQGLADLHWVNAVRARDRDAAPLKASHHFMQAAALALDPARAASAYWAGRWLGSGPRLVAAADLGPVLATAAFDGEGETLRLWGHDGANRRWSAVADAAPALAPGRPSVQLASPGGAPWRRHLVVHGEDGRAAIHDRRSGALRVATPPATEGVWLGAEETFAVSRHAGGAAWVWDLARGERLGALPTEAPFEGVAIAPGGARLLWWTPNGTAAVWERASARVAARFEDAIVGGALGRGERELVLWTRDGRLWLPRMPELRLEPAPGGRCSGRAIGARFLADGARLLVWNHGACGTARLWDLAEHRPIGPVMRHRDELAPPLVEGERIVTWSPGAGPARLWDATSGAALASLAGPASGVRFAVGGALLSWGGREARLWDGATGEPLGLPMRHGAAVMGATASDDGRRLLSWDSDGGLRLWRVPPPPATKTLRLPAEVLDAALVPGEAAARIVTLDGRVQAWSPATEAAPSAPQSLDPGLVQAAFADGGRRLMTSDVDGAVRLWSREDGAFQALAAPGGTAGDDPVVAVVWSPDADRLLFWGERGCTAWLWRVGLARVVPVAHGGDAGASCRLRGAAFFEGGARLLTWGEDRRLALWDLESPAPESLGTLAEGSLIRSVEADGDRLLIARDGGEVTLEGLDGAAVVTLRHDGVRGARWHAGSGRVLSWGGAGVRLWDAADGARLAALPHDGLVAGAAFTADGERLLSWRADGVLRLWEAAGGQPLTPLLPFAGRSLVALDRENENESEAAAMRVLVAADDRVTLRQWPPFAAPPDPPVRHQEALTGTRLTALGEVEALPAAAWQRLAAEGEGTMATP